MATCVDLAGAKYPKEANGQPITPLEGRSLLPAFAGKPIDRDAIYWEHEGNRAVRAGQLEAGRQGRPAGTWELYDMDADRTEMHDLAVGGAGAGRSRCKRGKPGPSGPTSSPGPGVPPTARRPSRPPPTVSPPP